MMPQWPIAYIPKTLSPQTVPSAVSMSATGNSKVYIFLAAEIAGITNSKARDWTGTIGSSYPVRESLGRSHGSGSIRGFGQPAFGAKDPQQGSDVRILAILLRQGSQDHVAGFFAGGFLVQLHGGDRS